MSLRDVGGFGYEFKMQADGIPDFEIELFCSVAAVDRNLQESIRTNVGEWLPDFHLRESRFHGDGSIFDLNISCGFDTEKFEFGLGDIRDGVSKMVEILHTAIDHAAFKFRFGDLQANEVVHNRTETLGLQAAGGDTTCNGCENIPAMKSRTDDGCAQCVFGEYLVKWTILVWIVVSRLWERIPLLGQSTV